MENHTAEEGNKMINEQLTNKAEDGPMKMNTCCSKALPFVTFGGLVFTLLWCFGIYPMAIAYGHVEPILPYMSDSWTTPPEAGYFCLISFLSAIITFLQGLIRYRQIKFACETKIISQKQDRILKLNKYNLAAYFTQSIGVLFYVSFRVNESLLFHVLICIILGIFGWILMVVFDTMISLATQPQVTTRRLAMIRKYLLIFFLICCNLSFVALVWSAMAAKDGWKQFTLAEKRMKWKPDDGGYEMHVLSTSMEWISTLIWAVFLATFYFDFKRCKVVNRDIQFEPYN